MWFSELLLVANLLTTRWNKAVLILLLSSYMSFLLISLKGGCWFPVLQVEELLVEKLRKGEEDGLHQDSLCILRLCSHWFKSL